MDKYIGRLLDGRYEILEVIGIGGMAVVYKAMDHRLNRLVAVKVLKDDYFNDAEFRRRFQGESQAVAMMSHPNIVNVYDVSKNTDGMDYIVMELIDGITLKQYMAKKGPLSWRETLHFSMQIAKALEHAHSRSIIHRDIKPHNIMILKDGSVKVADFGIARVASTQNTLTKEALGSVHYISPEQARGGRVDNRTDIYSLGVVMYEMLTGRPPYDGETPVSVAIQHINGTPLSPSLLNSAIPTGLEQITMHAMCADLNIRYASVTDLLRDLEEFRKDPSIRFTFLPAGGTAAVTAPARNPAQRPVNRNNTTKTTRREPEHNGRNGMMILAIALAVVALVGILVLVIAGRSRPSTETTDTAALAIPQLVGSMWDEHLRQEYPNLSLVINEDSFVFSNEFPEGVICDQSIPAGRPYPPNNELYLYISKGEQTDTMPDLFNKSEEYALEYFKSMEIKINALTEKEFSDVVEEGYVTRTDPEAGTTLKAGQIVTIYISKGPEFKKIKMPNVTGMDQASAIQLLKDNNLEYTTREEYSATAEKGTVISQNPVADLMVEEGTVVTLVISKGKQTATVPSVVGFSESEAKNRLTAAGFRYSVNYSNSDTVSAGLVIEQNYSGGDELMPGATVTITVSLGPRETTPPQTEPQPVTEPVETQPIPDLPIPDTVESGG